jgi:WD40 repeat protein
MSVRHSLIATFAVATLFTTAMDVIAQTDRYGDPLPKGAIGRLGTTRLQHGSPVHDLAFLADGKTLASLGCDNNGAVQLWDIATGKEIRHYRLSDARQTSAFFSPDRKLVVVLNDAGYRLLDTATGKERYRNGEPPEPNGWHSVLACFSGDGRILARVNRDTFFEPPHRILLDDVSNGKRLRALIPENLGNGGPHDLVASPDGKLLAVGSFMREFQIWELATGKHLYSIPSDRDQSAQVAFSPDGKTLARYSRNGWDSVELRDAVTGKRLWHNGLFGFGVSVAFTPDAKAVAIAARSGMGAIHIHDARTYDQIQTLRFSRDVDVHGSVRALAFSPDGQILAVLMDTVEGHVLHIWHRANSRKSLRVRLPSRPDWGSPSFSNDGTTLALTSGNAIQLWDTATAKARHAFPFHDGVVELAVSPDGQGIATAEADGSMHLWDAATCAERARWNGMQSLQMDAGFDLPLARLAYAADGRTVSSYGFAYNRGDASLCRWSALNGRLLRQVDGPADTFLCALAPDCKSAVWVKEDGKLGVFDLATGRRQAQFLVKLPERFNQFRLDGVFTADGRRLAVTGIEDATTRQWDLVTQRDLPPLSHKDEDWPTALAYSSDGRTLAGFIRSIEDTGVRIVELRLWEAATGCCIHRIDYAGETPRTLAFAPHGRRLAVGFTNGTIRLIDALTGKVLAKLEGHRGEIRALRFSPDGATLCSASADTTVLIWQTDVAPSTRSVAPDRLELHWLALAGNDTAGIFQALATLASAPDQAVKLLREKLKPAAAVDVIQLRRSIVELDSDDFSVRDKAMQRLRAAGEQAETEIAAAVKVKPSLEVRRRLEQLLERIHGVPSADRLRELRAIQTLEVMGTADACALLAAFAKGAPGAWLTREAQESLERLQRLSAP